MGNYKSVHHKQTIRVAGVETNLPIDSTIVHLLDQVVAAAVADGFRRAETGVIYSVTAGKTYRILGVMIVATSAQVQTIVISTGDTENAETATLITIDTPYLAATPMWYAVDKSLAAGKFLTYNPSSTNVEHIEVIGYET